VLSDDLRSSAPEWVGAIALRPADVAVVQTSQATARRLVRGWAGPINYFSVRDCAGHQADPSI
jgi:hypothetical protein